MIEFVNTKQPITFEDINSFEQEYNFKLPKLYKQHIIKYNGGYSREELYFKGYSIDGFRPMKYGDHTIEEDIESLKGFLPEKSFPFAYSSGGYIYISFEISNYEKLFIKYSDGQVDFLANSFKEFMGGLKNEPYDF